MANLTTAQQNEVKRLQTLGFTEAEAVETVLYDEEVEHGRPTEFDLTEEQKKVAKKYTDIGTKKRKGAYQFTARERKPNETKRKIMTCVRILFEGMELNGECKAVNLSNVERQLDFEVDGKEYSLTLTEHRPKK